MISSIADTFNLKFTSYLIHLQDLYIDYFLHKHTVKAEKKYIKIPISQASGSERTDHVEVTQLEKASIY